MGKQSRNFFPIVWNLVIYFICVCQEIFFVMFECRKKKFRRIFPDFISMCEMEWKKFRRTFFSHIWRQVKKVEFDWQCLTICDNVKKKMKTVFYKKKKKMSGEMLNRWNFLFSRRVLFLQLRKHVKRIAENA